VTRFLLDTNVLSDLVRNPQGRVAAGITEVGEDMICTSIIVAAELRLGAAKKVQSASQARWNASSR
jgi:tRNA(fMet)-specific endonuclease VapC